MKIGIHLVEFELTHKCTQKCKHCYLGDTSDLTEIDSSIVYRALDECKFLGAKHIVITGGEATLHPEWVNILEYAKEKDFNIQFETDGTLIKKHQLKYLKDSKIDVHLSIDAPPKCDSWLRPKEYNSHIVEFAKNLKNNGILCYFFCTLHKKNLIYLDNLINLANKINIPIYFNQLVPVGRAVSQSEILFSNEEWFEILTKLQIEYENNRILRTNSCYTVLVDKKERERAKKINKEIAGGCIAGIGLCGITPKGDVIPCPHLRIPVGNLNNKSLKDIWWNSTLMNKLRDRNNLKGECNVCEYRKVCGGCRGSTYIQTSDVFEQDPFCFKEFAHIS